MAERARGKRRNGEPDASSLEKQLDLTTGDMLNALDSPDDGENFDSGDASDFAGEKRKRNTRKSEKR